MACVGDTLSEIGRVEVTTVSRVTEGQEYVSTAWRSGGADRPHTSLLGAGHRIQ